MTEKETDWLCGTARLTLRSHASLFSLLSMPPASAPLPTAHLVRLLRGDPELRASFDDAKWQAFDENYRQYEVRAPQGRRHRRRATTVPATLPPVRPCNANAGERCGPQNVHRWAVQHCGQGQG